MTRKVIWTCVIVGLLLIVAGVTSATYDYYSQLELMPTSTPEIQLPDSDGDGMNDWFEDNVAELYDSTIPNDRYVVLYVFNYGEPKDEPNPLYQFLVGEGKIPPENIINLRYQDANASNLKSAIEEIAEKTEENDIVFVWIASHGAPGYFAPDVYYSELDEWLDGIEAKVVVVTISACHCETALPVIADGPCPRIVYVHTRGEFIRIIGADPEYLRIADTQYGNGDGYISLGEVENYLTNDPKWGYIQGTNSSDIDPNKIYLTDFKWDEDS